MSLFGSSELEFLLKLCASTHPTPWFPKAHSEAFAEDKEGFGEVVEFALLEKLISRDKGSNETGPGLMLTPLGRRLLDDPDYARRLHEGRPFEKNSSGAIVRASLRRTSRPYLTQLLVVANLALFAWGAFLARHHAPVLQGYLFGFIKGNEALVVQEVWHRIGAATAVDIIQGEWWRLMSLCFVHAGLLHLGMNMLTLYLSGAFVEHTWGRLRYFIIYMISGWGGSCLGLAWTPRSDVGNQFQVITHLGASGAICGVLAAGGVWILLNGRHLPREIARRGRGQLVTVIVLMVISSLLPGVSAWGHLGGAIAGTITALLLHLNRFAPRYLAWPALLALIPLPLLGVGVIRHQRMKNPDWFRAEAKAFRSQFTRQSIEQDLQKTDSDFRRLTFPLLGMNPTRRPPQKVEEALESLQTNQEQLTGLKLRIEGAGPYYAPDVLELRQQIVDRIDVWIKLIEKAIAKLEKGQGKRADAEEQEFEKEYLPRIAELARAGNRAFALYAAPLLKLDAAKRNPFAVRQAVRILRETERPLVLLAEDLNNMGPAKNEAVEEARKVGKDYLDALANLLGASGQGLAKGTLWTAKEQKQWEQQRQRAMELRKKWAELVS
jgi:rhomboid protease GluP